MIDVQKVTKKYGSFVAVEDVSLSASSGVIYGLVGYNGAGKTTLLKTIAGIYRPESGSVLADGENVFGSAGYPRQMFLLSDDPYFAPQASLDDMRHIYSGYYPNWSDKTFKKLSELFGLDRCAKINGFSKGMQRQAAIVLALATHPRYLLMDEAFDGLDLSKRNLLKKLLRQYVCKKQAVLVASSHNLLELEELADRIGILRDRKLCFDDSVENMRLSRSKYQADFQRVPDMNTLRALGLTDIRKLGEKTFTFVGVGGANMVLRDKLTELGASNIGSLPMTLEEFFLEEMDEQSYEFNDIF